MTAQVVTGYAKTQQAISGGVEYVTTLKTPVQMTFVCPEGIDIITKNEAFSAMIFGALRPTVSLCPSEGNWPSILREKIIAINPLLMKRREKERK